MANLLEETIEVLEENEKSFDDVIGICGDSLAKIQNDDEW